MRSPSPYFAAVGCVAGILSGFRNQCNTAPNALGHLPTCAPKLISIPSTSNTLSP